MNKHSRIFQLYNCDGEEAMLFICFDSMEETTDEDVILSIESAFEQAREEETEDVIERAEEILSKENIERTYAVAVNTNVI